MLGNSDDSLVSFCISLVVTVLVSVSLSTSVGLGLRYYHKEYNIIIITSQYDSGALNMGVLIMHYIYKVGQSLCTGASHSQYSL